MPEISRFLGIIIFMNWGDHPLPHFHAKYGAYEILVEIETGVVKGQFPKRALRPCSIVWTNTKPSYCWTGNSLNSTNL